ncbi:MAG: hypothetical protein GIW94_01705 [Candidatus Eremiobacteraeota bacterium]|nr:hypothetical protein [Candidatus Eremiobacteraeota bacterium]MBC5824051.1 hypothetical protein [Candidatus Eremiobacteraeota bacterium]
MAVLVLTLLASPILLSLLRPTYTAEATVAQVQDDSSRTPILQTADLPAIATSVAVLQRVKDQLHIGAPIDQMRKQLSVGSKTDSKTDVLPIDYRDRNPAVALKVSNAVADSLVDYYRYLATRQYRDLQSALRAQLAEQRNRIRDLDGRIAKAVEGNSYSASDKAQDTLAASIASLESQRGVAYATLVADRASAAGQGTNAGLNGVINEQSAASDPYYQALRTGQAKDASELQFEKAGYTDQYPGIAGLQEKVSRETAATDTARKQAEVKNVGASTALTQILFDKQHADSLVAADQARVNAVDQQVAQMKQRLSALSTAGVSADALRLQRDASQANYQQISVKLQTSLADESAASTLSSLFVLSRALGAYPFLPAFALELIVSLLIVGVAIGSAYAAEALDPRIRTTTDVENVYGASHIGSVH